MKAAYYTQQGDAKEVLKIGQLPKIEPKPNQVRVKVITSGVNPSDLKNRSNFGGAFPMKYEKVIPHQDGAGIIEAVGENVSKDRIGERVWIFQAQDGKFDGTSAEFVVVDEKRVAHLPDNISFEIGASLGIPAMTAHRALFSYGDIKGLNILIHGGAGVVGEAAILLAKWAGAYVITTIRKECDRELAKKAGADVIINMKEEDTVKIIKEKTDSKGVDLIIEVNLKANFKLDLDCIAQGGHIVTYALGKANDEVALPVFTSMKKTISFRFVFTYNESEESKQQAVKDIISCLKQGKYHPNICLVTSLEDIAKAHIALEERKVPGKILVKIQEA